jgi:hypothetical protein
MKTTFAAALVALSIVGCSSTPTKAPQPTAAPVIHEQIVGDILITYDDSSNWIKLVTTGSAPLHNSTPHATSEASKVAFMHAKQSLAEFMTSDFKSTKVAKTESNSKMSGSDDTNMTVLTTVVENIKDNSTAILRGVQLTGRTVTDETVIVELTVSKLSINASRSLQSAMSGAAK